MVLQSGANVFLTGEPGSGKSYTVNRYSAWLEEQGIPYAVTASTGIAATHVGGTTLHSWTGMGINDAPTPSDLKRIADNRRTADRIRNAQVLIIDEVSMLSAATLSLADQVCRFVRDDPAPFGGLQVVLVGDFFQLPPVSRRDPAALPGMAPSHDFAFTSPVWNELDLHTCYLTEQHRQSDASFLGLLTAMRSGNVQESHHELLLSRRVRPTDPRIHEIPRLFTHNSDADRVNEARLKSLPGEEAVYDMVSDGPPPLIAALQKSCLSPVTLVLKENARVMCTKNDFDAGFINGTLGTVTGFTDEGAPIVKTDQGDEIEMESMEWKIEENGKVLARVYQLPLRLAWAITVHKSQGMSLSSAYMDLTDAFEFGQGYVALSRVRTLSGLHLGGLNARALHVHPVVSEIDTAFRADSERLENDVSNDPDRYAHLRDAFVAMAGNRKPEEKKESKTKQDRDTRLQKTLELLRNLRSVEAVAAERGRTVGTILTHLWKLYEQGQLTPSDIEIMREGHRSDIDDVHDAVVVLGTRQMKTLYDHFRARIPYDVIRLALMLPSTQ